jgi:hypothetical protein
VTNFTRVLATCVCLQAAGACTSRTRAEPLERESVERSQPAFVPETSQRLSVGLELRLGATTAPYFTRSFVEVRGHGIVGVAQASYRLTERNSFAVQVPLLAISVEQPAGAYLDEFAWGNLNLLYRLDHTLLDTPQLSLTLHSGASVALPIAEQSRSASLLSGRALRIGSALDGFRHPELYTEGVMPLAGSIGVTLVRWPFSAELDLRLPLLLRFSNADLPDDARTHRLSVATVLHLAMATDATRWLRVSLSADTVLSAVPAVETARASAPVQFTLSPALTFRLPRGIQLGTTFVLPVAGALGGSTYAGSLLLRYAR